MKNKQQTLKIIKLILPWLIGIAIVSYLVDKYDPRSLLTSDARWTLFIIMALLYFSFSTLWDSLLFSWLFTQAKFKLSMKELFIPRVVSYIPAILNYNLGQASIAIYLKKYHKIPLGTSMACLVLLAFADLFIVVSLASLGCLMYDFHVKNINLSQWILSFSLFFYPSFALFLLIAKGKLNNFLPNRLRKSLETVNFFKVFQEAKLSSYLKLIIFRLPLFLAAISFTQVLFYCFYAQLSFGVAFAAVPLALFVGTIPITPGGIGTSQAAMVLLFGPFLIFGNEENNSIVIQSLIFNATLLWVFANYLLKALSGSIYMRRLPSFSTLTQTSNS